MSSVKHPMTIVALHRDAFESAGPLCLANDDGSGGEFKKITFLGKEAELGKYITLRQRSHLEIDASYRQVLPYIVLRLKQPGQEDLYFTYQRTKLVGEERLAGNYSIGLGGHIDLADVAYVESVVKFDLTVRKGMAREIYEELAPVGVLNGQWHNFEQYGVIADSDTKVGIYHTALVAIVDVGHMATEARGITCQEAELKTVGWLTLRELAQVTTRYDKLEPWSKILVDEFVKEAGYHTPV